MITYAGGSMLRAVIRYCEGLGYTVYVRKLDSRNVGLPSARARAYLAAHLSEVLMVSEHHRGPEHLGSLRKEAVLCGRKLVFAPAWPTDRSAEGTSGGELLLFANHMHATGIDDELIQVVMHRADPLRRKWSAAI